MIYLIGLGLNNDDISLKAIDELNKCDTIYLETYTTEFDVDKKINFLKKFTKNKNIIKSPRKNIENNPEIITQAKTKNVGVIIYGDPLIATTHTALLQQAIQDKIKYEIIHNISVLNAITNTGLHIYKFGKIASLPKWQLNYKPDSFYHIISDNQKIDAHTLLLIDIGLDFKDALSQILTTLKKHKSKLINDKIIVCQRLGQKDEKIFYGMAVDLKKIKVKIKHPFCIIFPSKLHFTESEFLNKVSMKV